MAINRKSDFSKRFPQIKKIKHIFQLFIWFFILYHYITFQTVINAEVMELVYMYAWGAYALWLEGSSPFLSIYDTSLGNRLKVGRRTLTPSIQVRILVPQSYIMRSRETVSRRAHNPKVGGSIPSSATKEIQTIGNSLIGRASDSESGGSRFES